MNTNLPEVPGKRENNLVGHGSAGDRGSADRYYGRCYQPHYYGGSTGNTARVEKKDMTAEEIEAYRKAYNEETDRKDWY